MMLYTPAWFVIDSFDFHSEQKNENLYSTHKNVSSSKWLVEINFIVVVLGLFLHFLFDAVLIFCSCLTDRFNTDNDQFCEEYDDVGKFREFTNNNNMG